MLAIVYLIASFLASLVLVQRLARDMPPLVRLAGAFVAGLLLTAWVTFLSAYALSSFVDDAVLVGALIALGANIVVIAWGWRLLDPSSLHLTAFEAVFAGAALIFSFWLMDARLSGDPLSVSANTWGDTALHVALARSFSWGHNFPPEYPFYGGQMIRYHFGYDFFAGALNAQGLPIAWAFNLPGAVGFASMMMLVFELGRRLFRNAWAGLIAVVLLITNGSLSFLRYFQQFDSIPEALKPDNWWHQDKYLAIGPYLVDGKVDKISIYWTLNVFLTQTHLIVGMALVLFVGYGLVRRLHAEEPLPTSEALALGALFGLSFWLNGVLFTAAMVFFGALFFVYGGRLSVLPALIPVFAALMILGWAADAHFYFLALIFTLGSMFTFGKVRESLPFLFVAGIIALPQMIWLNGGLSNDGSISEHTAYLVCASPQESCNAHGFHFDDLGSYGDFVQYWWLNLGLALPLMVLAAIWARGKERKLMLAVMGVFIFGNFAQLSRDLGGHNHKVFNLWEILMNLFAASAFVKLGNLVGKDINLGRFKLSRRDVNMLGRAALPMVFVVLVLSGIIDFMVIKNDPRYLVFGDKEQEIDWIDAHTPRDSLFLTAYGDLYTAPTLAGRRVFLGYEPWASSAGYDVPPRQTIVNRIYGAASKADACRLLRENGIDYVELGPAERGGGRFAVNEGLFSGQFVSAGAVDAGGGQATIYDVGKSCPSGASLASR